jgi:uncharacterized protein DUF6502
MSQRRAVRTIAPTDRGTVAESDQASLTDLLRDLALVLLPLGITPKAFTAMSREAFVSAAAATAKLRNGKISQSRISAQTGLTRADVRRILTGVNRRQAIGVKAPIDATRIGWTSDRAFLDRSKLPKLLPINGPGCSFASLARKYARDIPHRALLHELERTGAAVVREGKVRLKFQPSKAAGNDLKPVVIGPIRAIHRFKFVRDDGSDPNVAKRELKRLERLLWEFRHRRTDARSRASQRNKRHGDTSVALVTLIVPGKSNS